MTLRHTDSPECRCHPRDCMVCPECDDHETPPADCWRCGGTGLAEHDGSPDQPHLYVHALQPETCL